MAFLHLTDHLLLSGPHRLTNPSFRYDSSLVSLHLPARISWYISRMRLRFSVWSLRGSK